MATIHEIIANDRSSYRIRPGDVQKFRIYAAGEVDTSLPEKQQVVLEGLLEHKYSDNVCHQVISEANDRLIMEGWSCQNARVEQFLTDFYITADIKGRQGDTHYDTLRDGNHVLALGWDAESGRVSVTNEKWWDGEEGVFIGYKDNVMRYGVKDWYEIPDDADDMVADRILRRNIWTKGRLERWASWDNGNSWDRYSPPGMRSIESWVSARDNRPLAIPYIHFKNGGRGSTVYGWSELDGGVLAIQDQLNDLQLSMCGVCRMTAFKIYWATGIDYKEDDEEGFPENGPKVGAGEFWSASSPDSKFGSIEPGNAESLVRVYDKKVERLAQMTRTPLHRIKGGEWPSAEAIMRSEQPAVGKALQQIGKLSATWTQFAHRVVEIHNAFGRDEFLPEDAKTAMIETKFASPDRRDALARSIISANLGSRISDEEALRIQGYTDDHIERVEKEKAAARKRDADHEISKIKASREERPQPEGEPGSSDPPGNIAPPGRGPVNVGSNNA